MAKADKHPSCQEPWVSIQMTSRWPAEGCRCQRARRNECRQQAQGIETALLEMRGSFLKHRPDWEVVGPSHLALLYPSSLALFLAFSKASCV
eukprot:1161286-Pelagomonas_calceolata.AAC.7